VKNNMAPPKKKNPAKRTKAQRKYDASPAVKKRRAARNKARREAERDGRVSKGDGREVDHIKPLAAGGSNKKSNTRVVSAKTNRSKNLKRGGRKKGSKNKK
jgi:hypothetical protein